MAIECSLQVLKDREVPNFTKLGSVGDEFFLGDGRTDEHEGASSRCLQLCQHT